MLTVARAQLSDLPEVQAFIRDHWKANHILATDLELLQWQYRRPTDSEYNIVLARNESGILGVLGYVPSQLFERADLSSPTIWLALWKVRDDARIPGLGLMLWRFIADREKPALFATLGINEPTIPIYQRLGYTTGELDHHLLLNPAISDFRIFSHGSELAPTTSTPSSPLTLRELTTADWPSFANTFTWQQPPDVLPRKTLSYFENRYLHHPFYNYPHCAIYDQTTPIGLIILRKVEANTSAALRVIDAHGPPEIWPALSSASAELMRRHTAEYIDLLSLGIPSETLRQAGFHDRRAHPDWTVPNYFEPFSPKNAPVRYAAKTPPGARYLAFKGDGDQDRPNLLTRAHAGVTPIA